MIQRIVRRRTYNNSDYHTTVPMELRFPDLCLLPESMGHLTQMQELSITGCSSLRLLPDEICGMIGLRRLSICFCSHLLRLPLIMDRLQALEILQVSSCQSLREMTGVLLPNCLKKITVENCGLLRSLPEGISKVPEVVLSML